MYKPDDGSRPHSANFTDSLLSRFDLRVGSGDDCSDLASTLSGLGAGAFFAFAPLLGVSLVSLSESAVSDPFLSPPVLDVPAAFGEPLFGEPLFGDSFALAEAAALAAAAFSPCFAAIISFEI